MFNMIICGTAIVLFVIWFYHSLKSDLKNEELEERIKAIRSRLRIGAYAEALELTEVEYQYQADSVIDITDDKNEWYEIVLGNDKLYFDVVDDKDGTIHFNCIELTENGKTERLLTNEEWNKL